MKEVFLCFRQQKKISQYWKNYTQAVSPITVKCTTTPIPAALTTVYAAEKTDAGILNAVKTGDFTAGSVGLRTVIDETKQGSHTNFAGKRLVLSVGDFHESVKKPEHRYAIKLFAGENVVFSAPVDFATTYFALDADPDVPYYRAEVWDETRDLRIAIGNPIWNDR